MSSLVFPNGYRSLANASPFVCVLLPNISFMTFPFYNAVCIVCVLWFLWLSVASSSYILCCCCFRFCFECSFLPLWLAFCRMIWFYRHDRISYFTFSFHFIKLSMEGYYDIRVHRKLNALTVGCVFALREREQKKRCFHM